MHPMRPQASARIPEEFLRKTCMAHTIARNGSKRDVVIAYFPALAAPDPATLRQLLPNGPFDRQIRILTACLRHSRRQR